MVFEYLDIINKKKIILASSSPRRKMIFEQLGLKFEVVVSGFIENLDKSLFKTEVDYVTANSKGKCFDVVKKIPDADLIVGCDTVVLFDNKIVEKPKDEADAYRILNMLSGKVHKVVSVVTLVCPQIKVDGEPLTEIFHNISSVEFEPLSQAFIKTYIEKGLCYGKAGAYGIQDIGGCFVKRIDGCYANIVGFPTPAFCEHLDDIVKKYWIS
ncbi:maf protein, putative [Entamoeba invadens IP1]|uniref:Maf protein, putative n=1 Tax=Entamoeba invadens IP1 TaxID=370355 RepID=L7FN43_ENTIV|nr:maf protein, putative [Entamoeba invadens IP1]ELP91569.1 maf protein, putative [Entamoeba invadens IP1]|eukprot:XP_004258340.1 maf protein, putative [Entamoeba invadens IP1]